MDGLRKEVGQKTEGKAWREEVMASFFLLQEKPCEHFENFKPDNHYSTD